MQYFKSSRISNAGGRLLRDLDKLYVYYHWLARYASIWEGVRTTFFLLHFANYYC
jgi:hypothetical protein